MTESAPDRQPVVLAYILYAVSVIFPLGSIAGVIVNHLKIGDTQTELARSHHRWLMRTFWFGVLWGVIGFTTFPLFGLGYFIWIAAAIWFLYRLIRGWLNFSEDKPMYSDL